jgi:porin
MQCRDRTVGAIGRLIAACLISISSAALPARSADYSVGNSRPPHLARVEPEITWGNSTSRQLSMGPPGDPISLRAHLESFGVLYSFVYINEILGNVGGGFRQGPIYAGKLEASLTIDFGKLAGVNGLSLFANTFQIHDTGGLRDRSFGRLITVSNIEAFPSTRASEIWIEQKWSSDRFGLRLGQLTADGEFFSADYGKLFLSNDWPTITGANLPAGGPAYPVSTPGVRLRFDPDDSTSALAAVFNGDPGEQRLRNRAGTNFSVDGPPLVMAEVQHRYNQEDAAGLAGSFKLGGYYHFGRFDHLRFDRVGLPLASPSSTGVTRRLGGTSGIYVVAELQLQGGGPEDGITVYTRISASPSDRNLVDRWADGGIVFAGMVPGRPNDKFGASLIYAGIGESARGFDRDMRRLTNDLRPIRSFCATFEVSYQTQIMPGWVVQPDFQYVFKPAGGIVSPFDHTARVRGGPVFGLRSTFLY